LIIKRLKVLKPETVVGRVPEGDESERDLCAVRLIASLAAGRRGSAGIGWPIRSTLSTSDI